MTGTKAPASEPVAAPVSAAESIQRVMHAVGAVGKTGRNEDQKYNFRGIDAVVNAVGPALRAAGGFIKPDVLKVKREHGVTRNGAPVLDTFVKVRYSWFGSDGGEPVSAVVLGESRDTSDKGTAKAMSVAYRTFLLQTLCLPTDEPDPDETAIERATPAQAKAAAKAAAPKAPAKPPVSKGKWAEKIIDVNTTDELKAVWDEVEEAGELGLPFAAGQRKFVVETAKFYKLPEPPKDVTVAQLINVVRGALEAKAAAPAEDGAAGWPTAEIPKDPES